MARAHPERFMVSLPRGHTERIEKAARDDEVTRQVWLRRVIREALIAHEREAWRP